MTEKTTFTCVLTAEQKELLRRQAYETNRSISHLIRDAVDEKYGRRKRTKRRRKRVPHFGDKKQAAE